MMRPLLLTLIAGLMAASPAQAQTWVWPVNSPSTGQSYAALGLVVSGKYHTGIDLRSSTDDVTVKAAAAGRARVVPLNTFTSGMGENHGMGNVVIIDHGNRLFTLYAHLATITVSNNAQVSKGARIGTYGTTGCRLAPGGCNAHLHFELRLWPELGSLDDDKGPEWGYTASHPNLAGYLNPFPYVGESFMIMAFPSDTPVAVASSSAQPLRTGPGTDYVSQIKPSGGSTTTVQKDQQFFAIAQRSNWYQVFVPSTAGPGTGWIQAATSEARRAEVDDGGRGLVGVSVRASASTASPIRSYVWDDQFFAVLDEAPAGNECPGRWYQITLASNAGGGLGWVCKQYLIVPAEPDVVAIGEVSLSSPVPNPARSGAIIVYALPAPAAVTLDVYDLLGRRVAVLVEGEQPAGRHTVTWDASGLASGLYLVRMRSGAHVETRRITLLR